SEQPDPELLPDRHLGLARAAPDAVVARFDPVDARLPRSIDVAPDPPRDSIEPWLELAEECRGHRGALADDADLGVDQNRPRVEVERADEDGTAIEEEGLGVQRRFGAAEMVGVFGV